MTQTQTQTLKLFMVRLPSGNLLPQAFGTKAEAKALRDQYTGAVVVLGPDHKRNKRNGDMKCVHPYSSKP